MINPQALLPAVQKLLPEYSAQELLEGIMEFAKAHPDFNNQQAIQALIAALSHPTVKAARSQRQPIQGKPFEGLLTHLGAK